MDIAGHMEGGKLARGVAEREQALLVLRSGGRRGLTRTGMLVLLFTALLTGGLSGWMAYHAGFSPMLVSVSWMFALSGVLLGLAALAECLRLRKRLDAVATLVTTDLSSR